MTQSNSSPKASGQLINLFYYDSKSNFGDVLSPVIFNRLFGLEVNKTRMGAADWIAIGSLLDGYLYNPDRKLQCLGRRFFRGPLNVFGSGFIAKKNHFYSVKERFCRKMNFIALRGKESRDRVSAIYKKDFSSLPLGDPGLLASKLIDKDSVEKKYSLGIIAHYADKDIFGQGGCRCHVDDVTFIDIQSPVDEFLARMCECETIISTAMHGIIAADSLGIPNKWAVISDEVVGGGYKFKDYYSALEINGVTPLDLRKDTINSGMPATIVEDYPVEQSVVASVQQQLILAMKNFIQDNPAMK